MSDLQLITGLAIISSGFAQLRCGISAYHWQRIVHLAWFSSITHLSCLTCLRDYFYEHRWAQLWRIPGMVTLIIMLVVALVPTAHYAWEINDMAKYTRPRPSDHAICWFNHHELVNPWDAYEFSNLRQRQSVATVLLVLGMVNRLWRLYHQPTVRFTVIRRSTSSKSLHLLEWLHKVAVPAHTETWMWRIIPQALFRTVVYCPLLTVYLTTRLLVDVYTSMAFEVSIFPSRHSLHLAICELTFKVWWLPVSFTWGALALWPPFPTVNDESRRQGWTFGQTTAIFVLLSPLIGLIEGSLSMYPILPSKLVRCEANIFLKKRLRKYRITLRRTWSPNIWSWQPCSRLMWNTQT